MNLELLGVLALCFGTLGGLIALISAPTKAERKAHARGLLVQLAATSLLMTAFLAVGRAPWWAGVFAPTIGLLAITTLLTEPPSPDSQVAALALLCLLPVVLTVRGASPRWLGHLGLAASNLLSFSVVLAGH